MNCPRNFPAIPAWIRNQRAAGSSDEDIRTAIKAEYPGFVNGLMEAAGQPTYTRVGYGEDERDSRNSYR